MNFIENPIHIYRHFLKRCKRVEYSNIKYITEEIRREFEKNREINPDLTFVMIKVFAF